MKSILSFLAIASIVVAFSSCGGSKTEATADTTKVDTAKVVAAPAAAADTTAKADTTKPAEAK